MSNYVLPLYAIRARRKGYEVSVMKRAMGILGKPAGPVRPPLVDVRVLIYRESRGWEVKYPAFTDQFRGARLTSDGKLDQSIDGISGATLSVHALTRLARLALLLDQHARA